MARYRSDTYKITDAKTHHFFVVNPETGNMLCDEDYKILVFLNREKAEIEATRLWGQNSLHMIVGMGDEKWALFQAEMEYRVIT